MCIMEVRAGQRSTTITQALAHNTSTVERDMDMLEELLKARGEEDVLAQVQHAHEHLRAAYAGLLGVFGQEVARVNGFTGHDDHDHGAEREMSLVEMAHHDAGLARRYETR